MNIRLGKLSDKIEFLRVQKQAFPKLDSKKQAKYFIQKLKNKELLVAIDKKDYFGHVCFGKHTLNPPFTGGIFVEELAVKSEYKGKGIGTSLLKNIIHFSKKKGYSVLYLGTGDYKRNKAITYYKNLGFQEIGKLKEINPKSEYKYGQRIFAKIIG